MDKFFKLLNKFVASRFFRFLLTLLLVGYLANSLLRRHWISWRKLEEVLEYLQKRRGKTPVRKFSNLLDVIPGNKVKFATESKMVRKQIVPDKILEQQKEIDAAKEQQNKQVTGVLKKLQLLEESYKKRLLKKQLNRRRVAEYGDFIYYQMGMILNIDKTDDSSNTSGHFFMQLQRGDTISAKLVGKKINQLQYISYDDFLGDLSPEEKEELKQNISSTAERINRVYKNKYNKEVFQDSQFRYQIVILDFIPLKLIKDLELEELVTATQDKNPKSTPK
jgi:hypothetical protein